MNQEQAEVTRNALGVSPPQTKTITEAALLKRISRRLPHENQAMRKARRWTVVDRHGGTVESAHHDDIAAFARDEGLVRPGECVEVGAASTEAR